MRAAEVVPEKGRRVPWIGKRRAKEFVVRLVNGFVRHEGERPAEGTAATQRSVARRGRIGRKRANKKTGRGDSPRRQLKGLRRMPPSPER